MPHYGLYVCKRTRTYFGEYFGVSLYVHTLCVLRIVWLTLYVRGVPQGYFFLDGERFVYNQSSSPEWKNALTRKHNLIYDAEPTVELTLQSGHEVAIGQRTAEEKKKDLDQAHKGEMGQRLKEARAKVGALTVRSCLPMCFCFYVYDCEPVRTDTSVDRSTYIIHRFMFVCNAVMAIAMYIIGNR